MKLIEKDAVLAEIDELNTAFNEKINSGVESSYWRGLSLVCERLKFRINSLEVTEVAKITQHDIKIYINNKAQKGE